MSVPGPRRPLPFATNITHLELGLFHVFVIHAEMTHDLRILKRMLKRGGMISINIFDQREIQPI